MFKKIASSFISGLLGITIFMNGETGEVLKAWVNKHQYDVVIKVYLRQNRAEFYQLKTPIIVSTIDEMLEADSQNRGKEAEQSNEQRF